MKSKDLQERIKKFAHDCVKLSARLPNIYLGNHIKGQLIRCSASSAADYRAACLAQLKASFITKLSIVIEEIDESYFWLEYILDEKLLKREAITPLLKEAYELTAIFTKSRITARRES